VSYYGPFKREGVFFGRSLLVLAGTMAKKKMAHPDSQAWMRKIFYSCISDANHQRNNIR